jgi:hypothetical protein
MVMAGLFLPGAARAQSCSEGACESWAVFDPDSGTISGGSYYENNWASAIMVESYIWDPNYNYTYLGSAVDYGYAEFDFTYTPELGGTYTIAGYNWYELEDYDWIGDGSSGCTVWASAQMPYPNPTPVIQGVSPAGPWQAGTSFYIDVYGNGGANGGFGTNPSLQVTGPDGSTYFSGSCLGSNCDTDIVVWITIPSDAPGGYATATVTSDGWDGLGFMGGGSGNSPTSNGYSVELDPEPGSGDPKFMIVVYDNSYTVPGHSYVRRDVTYQVMLDDTHNAGRIAICEAVTDTNWSCNQTQPTPSIISCNGMPGATDANGEFTDSWAMYSDSFTPTGCGWDTVDAWKIFHDVWSAVTFGTLTGYLHNDAIKINGVVSPAKIPAGTKINP